MHCEKWSVHHPTLLLSRSYPSSVGLAGELTMALLALTIGPSLQTGQKTMKTDLQLQQDVIDELKWEPAVNSVRIGVEVKDGYVTLAGDVNSYGEKVRAERAAQRVTGVKALAVTMKVKLPNTGKPSDVEIAESARNILDWTRTLAEDSIKVMVERGWLTLTGDVGWQYQRQNAEDRVRYLAGVTGVSNQIAIRPSLSSNVVKADIEAALKRRTSSDATRISVSVNGADVTLTGTVQSWADRELATHSAWGSAGVHKVIDKLIIGV